MKTQQFVLLVVLRTHPLNHIGEGIPNSLTTQAVFTFL